MPETLVTGGAGFIGSHTVEHLVRLGHEVTVLDDLSGGFAENVERGAVGLGMVVRNVGTLYRLRYPFRVLLVILAAGGAARLLSKARATKPAQ